MSTPAVDKRILNLSYSSLLTLHTCPRKFQLYKLGTAPDSREEDVPGSVTFAYGHMVGRGIQRILEGASLSQILWEEFYQWDCDLYADNPKQGKSFFRAWIAIRQFHSMREAGYLDGFELVSYQGKLAAELSFSIQLPDGFIYRGFVDAVLQHAITGEVLVLECKTSSATHINPAQYKNSAQAIGYSIVLDAIFPELSSYKVLYLVYQSKSAEYIQLPFEKTYYQRALWIQELLLDIEVIKLYEGAECYPMHGESCYSYFRECEFYQTCTLSTRHLIAPLTTEASDRMDAQLEEFQIKVTINDLIDAQLRKEVSAGAVASSISDLPNGDILL
jgi:hypothetical protein